MANFARIDVSSGGTDVLADDAALDGDTVGVHVAVGGTSNDVAVVGARGKAHVFRGGTTEVATWHPVHEIALASSAALAAAAVAGDYVVAGEPDGDVVVVKVQDDAY